MTLTLIITLVQTILGVLTQQNILPGTVNALVAAASAALGPLFAAFNSGKGTTAEITAVLVTLQTAVDAVKSDKNIPADLLQKITAMDTALQATLKNDVVASATVDPNTLTDIAPVS